MFLKECITIWNCMGKTQITKHITPMAFELSLSSDSLKGSGGTLNTMEIPSTNGEPKSTSCSKACVPESVTSAHLQFRKNVPFTGLS